MNTVPTSSFLFAASTTLFCAALAGQTFIVDADNRPGTNFTDLPAAIAAVPSGATLRVRSSLVGAYSAFQIAGKSVHIIGERNPSFPAVRLVNNAATISIGPLSASQLVSISGLTLIDAAPNAPLLTLQVTNCAGPVLIEDVSVLRLLAAATVRIISSTNVHCSRLSLAGSTSTGSLRPVPVVVQASSVEFTRLSANGYDPPFGGSGTPALEASQQSRIVLVDPSVVGGPGAVLFPAGGPAVVLTNGSTLHAFANGFGQFRGGAGATAPVTGRGGDALVLQGGSSARVRGLTLVGGAGTPPGQPFTRDASSTIDYSPTDITPSASLVGAVQPGSTVRYTLRGRPGSATALLVGFDARFQMLPILALGALGVNGLATIGPATVPASGVVEFASLVPNSWPTNTILLAQFLVYDPTVAELRMSNLFTATSRF